LIADADEGEHGSYSGNYKGYTDEAGADERFYRNKSGHRNR